MPARIRLVGAASVIVFVAAGCAQQSGTDENAEPAIGAVPVITEPSQVRLPLDPYRQTDDQIRLFSKAHQILSRDCMRRFGLDWTVSAPPQSTGQDTVKSGVLTTADAAKYGYHNPDSAITKTGNEASAQITPDQQAVFTGKGPSTFAGQPVPPGGCAGEANTKLTGTAGDPTNAHGPIVSRLATDAYTRTTKDSRVRMVVNAWTACMKKAGFDYANPDNAGDDVRWRGQTPSDLEFSTAKADAACRQETNYTGVFVTVETAYQERLIEKNSQQLDAEKKSAETALRNATKVIGGG